MHIKGIIDITILIKFDYYQPGFHLLVFVQSSNSFVQTLWIVIAIANYERHYHFFCGIPFIIKYLHLLLIFSIYKFKESFVWIFNR